MPPQHRYLRQVRRTCRHRHRHRLHRRAASYRELCLRLQHLRLHNEIADAINETQLDNSEVTAQAATQPDPRYDYAPTNASQEVPAFLEAAPRQTGSTDGLSDQSESIAEPQEPGSVSPISADQPPQERQFVQPQVAKDGVVEPVRASALLNDDPIAEENSVLSATTVKDAATQASAIVDASVNALARFAIDSAGPRGLMPSGEGMEPASASQAAIGGDNPGDSIPANDDTPIPFAQRIDINTDRSIPESASEGLSVDQASRILSMKFGKGFDNFQDSGAFKLVQSVDDLPLEARAGMHGSEGSVYSNGTSYIVADNQSRGRIVRDVIEQIGEQRDLQSIVGDDTYGRMLRDVAMMKQAGNPLVARIWSAEKRLDVGEEGSEPFLGAVAARLGETPEGRASVPWNRIAGATRQFLGKADLRNISEQDVYDLVNASMRKTADDAKQPHDAQPALTPRMLSRSTMRDTIQRAQNLFDKVRWSQYCNAALGDERMWLKQWETFVANAHNSENERAFWATTLMDKYEKDTWSAKNESPGRIFREMKFMPEEGIPYLVNPAKFVDEYPRQKDKAISKTDAYSLMQFGKQLGVNVHFFRQGREFRRIDGIANYTFPSHIFLNAGVGDAGWQYVLGHEFFHQMPMDLKHDFISIVKSAVYDEDYLRAKKYVNQPWLSADRQWEEIAADLMGNRFGEPEFWACVLPKIGNASLMQKLIDHIKNFIAKIKEISRPEFHTDDYVWDLELVLEEAVRIMQTYLARRGENGGISGEFENDYDAGTRASVRKAEAERILARLKAEKSFASPGKSVKVDLPDVIITHASNVGRMSAGTGLAGAKAIVKSWMTPELIERVRDAAGETNPIILPVRAPGNAEQNYLADAAAALLSERLGLDEGRDIIRSAPSRGNEAAGFSGLDRVFNRPVFDGPVEAGRAYLLVDDHLNEGGTFAALSRHIEAGGGRVVGAVAMAGMQYNAQLALSNATLARLRLSHGEIEDQFTAQTGHGFGALTESEARTLANAYPPDAVRKRIISLPPDNQTAIDEATQRGGLSFSAGDKLISADGWSQDGIANGGSAEGPVADEQSGLVMQVAMESAHAHCAAVADARIVTAGVGRNIVSWLVDSAGSPMSAWGVLSEYKKGAKRSSAERRAQVGVAERKRGDDGGHLLAHRFIGDQGLKNLFSQNGNFNRSAYKIMENDLVRFIDQGNRVEFNFKLDEFDKNGRPGAVIVAFQVFTKNGQKIAEFSENFFNEHGQTYIRKA